ncbi:MAG: hypothetical protein WC608_05015 [Parcubacteria group bacterium]
MNIADKKNKKLGMTLIEALLAIMIFTFGILGFSQLFVKSWQSNQYSYEMGQSTFAVSQGVNKMVDYIRRARQGDDGSYPIKVADDDEFIFFCDYDKNGITERVHMYKSNGKILMGYRKPSTGLPKTYATGDEATLTLAQDVVNDANTPVFSYYNKNYPGDQTHNPVSTPAIVSDIRLVKINLAVDPNVNRAPNSVQMESFVEMRNLNDYDRIQ